MYSIQLLLRLRRKSTNTFLKFNQFRSIINTKNIAKTENKNVKILYEKYKDKIIFNSHAENDKLKLGYFKFYLNTVKQAKAESIREMKNKALEPLPVALKYVVEDERLLNTKEEETITEPEKSFQLPFNQKSNFTEVNESEPEKLKPKEVITEDWMTAYEHFDDHELEDEHKGQVDWKWTKLYGCPDPNIGVSNVPCGGCGALLHCNDPSIPGYLPSEIFKGRNMEELRSIECQRCHFLKEYNVALDVNVEPEEYERLLKSIR